MENNDKIAELQAQIVELKAENERLKEDKKLVVSGVGVSGDATVAGIAASESQTPEVLAELAKVSAGVSGRDVTKDAIVAGFSIGKKDDLTKLIQSFDEKTQNNLKGLLLHFQGISEDGKGRLGTVIKRIPELDENGLSKLLETIKDLT